MVLPSVYMAHPPERAQAVDVPFPGVGALSGAAAGYLACNLGSWVTGLFKDLPWMTPLFTKAETNVNKPQNLQTAGPAGLPPQAAPTPLKVEILSTEGKAAATSVAVPTSDVFLQEQNFQLSQQLAMLQRNTESAAQSGTQIAHNEESMTFKECVLDPLANMFKNLIIDAVTDSIVAWIKGGFDGTPSFLEDPSTFFRNVGESAVSAYLYESGLDEVLCEPFSLDVILGISWDFYMPDMDPQYGSLSCGLDEIFPGFDVSVGLDGSGNPITAPGYDAQQGYDAMFEDGNIDFPGGGWDTFVKSLDDNNNALGSKFAAQSAAAAFTAEQVSRESVLLDQGDGWFSPRCDIDNNPDTARSVCTPGEYVSEHVNEWSDGQLERLQLADEFAEIVNALLQLLIETVLSDGNDLLRESFRR